MHFYSHKKGFSLIEMLIYVAVLSIMMMAMVVGMLSLGDVFNRNKGERILTEAATTALERIGREVRSGESINLVSVFNNSDGLLGIDTGSTLTRFYISGGALTMSYNGIEWGPLTPNQVTVDSLTFWQFATSSSKAVRVALVLSIAENAASTTKTFYTTAVLRGSYD